MIWLGLVLFLIAIAATVGLVTVNFNTSVSVGTINSQENVVVKANGSAYANPSVPTGIAGTLTTMSTSTTGSLTMPAGHGITTGQRIDIYWTGGSCYGAVVGTVATNVVPIASVSGGTALPASGTAVVVGIVVSAPFELVGDNVQALILNVGSLSGYIVISTNSVDLLAEFIIAGNGYSWNGIGTNPLGSAVVPTKVYMSQAAASGISNTGSYAFAATN